MNDTEPTLIPPPVYGSFTNRMIASTLDIGVLLLVALPLIEFIMAHLFQPIDLNKIVAPLVVPHVRLDDPKVMAAFWRAVREQQLFERVVTENVLQVLCIALYIVPFWLRYSSSPGKMLFRLVILDQKTGSPMSRRQAVIRFLGYIVSGLPLSLGFIWILFNKKRRGFHDMIAGTVVVVKPKKFTLPSA